MRTGQIIQRGECTWLLRWYLGKDSNGKRKYKGRTVFGDWKYAVSVLQQGPEAVGASVRKIKVHEHDVLVFRVDNRLREYRAEELRMHLERHRYGIPLPLPKHSLERLWIALYEAREKGLTRNAIYNGVFRGRRISEDIERQLQKLVQLDRAYFVREQPGPKGGNATERWYAKFTQQEEIEWLKESSLLLVKVRSFLHELQNPTVSPLPDVESTPEVSSPTLCPLSWEISSKVP